MSVDWHSGLHSSTAFAHWAMQPKPWALPRWIFSTGSPGTEKGKAAVGRGHLDMCGPNREGQQVKIPLLLSFLDLRKMISLIKYNILYIQPTVQLLRGWFSFYLFPSNLCKRINTALDPHLLPGAHTELTRGHPIGTGIWSQTLNPFFCDSAFTS